MMPPQQITAAIRPDILAVIRSLKLFRACRRQHYAKQKRPGYKDWVRGFHVLTGSPKSPATSSVYST